jgi:hypothetical protein
MESLEYTDGSETDREPSAVTKLTPGSLEPSTGPVFGNVPELRAPAPRVKS